MIKSQKTQVKSGIEGFDKIAGGGMPQGSVVAVSGGTGSGKTTFAMQFLVKGALESKEPGVYISFDERKEGVAANMKSYGWDLHALEKEKKVVFIEYPVHEVEHFLSNESSVKGLVELLNVKRLVIDPIAPIALAYQNQDKRRIGIAKMVETIRKWGCTVLVLSDDEGAVTESIPSTKYGIEDVCDGYVRLYYLHRKGERKRYIEVVKMRGVHHENKIFEMGISDRGVSIDPAKKLA
ncbi:hypothetical protein FJZ26_02730 [Candidatus Parvarchaeota archaeon]|nr:hypothetical protein [Candidatus Parvarchaeota archaeon]